MPNEVPLVMPKMSMTMEKGELLSWAAGEGDSVRAGDVVAVVQTDKVDMDVESPVDGTLVRRVAEEGAVVPVGQPMAFISTEADSLMEGLFDEDPSPDAAAPEPAGSEPVPQAEEEIRATPPSRRGPQPAAPKARRRAAELRVSMGDVTPTGPNGVITVEDVERAADTTTDTPSDASTADTGTTEPAPDAAPAHQPAAATNGKPAAPSAPASGPAGAGEAADADPEFSKALAARRRSIREAVARTMSRSAAIPQFTTFAEIDLEELQRARDGVGWTTLLVRALARALRANPTVLAGWDDDAEAPAEPPEGCGVALAVDTAVGLLAPVIRDADTAPLAELDATIRDVVGRARAGRLTMPDLQGASSTLSNLGGFGVPSFTSLLTPPQASALSVGAIAPRPVAHHGGLAIRLGTTVGLTVDHRAVDGADAARVLAELRSLCEQPASLLQ